MTGNGIKGWAEALLEFPNLVFCVIDTTGVKRDSDVIRFLTLDKHGFLNTSLLISPGRQPGQCNAEWTGITPQEMSQAEALSERWFTITQALTGKFVLAYGLDFVQERLNENARHYGLKPITLVGDDLMELAPTYFRANVAMMKLVDACARIGYIMPERPNAEQRARGQLALLRAMAAGITNAPKPTPVAEEDWDELDAHPF